jgi:superfamily I DNA and/or RNA helicase
MNLEDIVEQEYLKLHPEQREAVDAMLQDCVGDAHFLLPIVDGPPGTGKTHTGSVAAGKYFLQNANKHKVLYVAYTNFALDRAKEALERLGFPSHDVIRLLPTPGLRDWKGGRIGCRWDLLDLSYNDIRRLQEAPFVLCTPYMLGRMERLGVRRKIIIDEFSQIDVPTFIMILNQTKDLNPDGFALLGDPLQLPVVTTQEELRENIVRFIRTKKIFEPHTLIVQHRMHKTICESVNNVRKELASEFSSSSPRDLVPSDKVKERGMEELGFKWNRKEAGNFEQILHPAFPLVIYNTDELGFEKRSPTGSWYHEGEAELAIEIAKAAYRCYTKNGMHFVPKIISPYSAQVYQIANALPIETQEAVTTVWRFQGREHPMVIVSMVRNNERGEIGFLDMPMLRGQGYVAISRAQAKLIVLMSKNTFSSHPIFNALAKTQVNGCLKVNW